jgi:hypothetical protein
VNINNESKSLCEKIFECNVIFEISEKNQNLKTVDSN